MTKHCNTSQMKLYWISKHCKFFSPASKHKKSLLFSHVNCSKEPELYKPVFSMLSSGSKKKKTFFPVKIQSGEHECLSQALFLLAHSGIFWPGDCRQVNSPTVDQATSSLLILLCLYHSHPAGEGVPQTSLHPP